LGIRNKIQTSLQKDLFFFIQQVIIVHKS